MILLSQQEKIFLSENSWKKHLPTSISRSSKKKKICKKKKKIFFHDRWRGEEVNEEGYDEKSGKILVKIDPRYFRPTEVENLLGDPAKAKKIFGWEPEISLEVKEKFRKFSSKIFFFFFFLGNGERDG